jgi:hypothetical protein
MYCITVEWTLAPKSSEATQVVTNAIMYVIILPEEI